MAHSSITLKEVDDVYLIKQGLDPFDQSNRPTKAGVFSNALCEIFSVNYFGMDWDLSDIEILILKEYSFYEIATETYDVFKQMFINKWNRGIFQLRENLMKSVGITLNDTKENFSENAESEARSVSNSNGENKYSNTPNQYEETPTKIVGLTELSKTNGNSEVDSNGESQRSYERTTTSNEFEKWLSLSSKNYNIIYKFIDSFWDLFSNTIVLKNYLRRY